MSDDFYRALEERFRASREEIRKRLEGYRPFLTALCQVNPRPKAFDIGCGRGEWLQLLTDEGLEAQGVDLDDSMLAACHERGLHAKNQDALEALRALPDASLDLISAFHVVEHLTFDYLQALLKEAHRTLSAQGLLILETPNAENLIVGTNNFYLDPTHQRPVPAIFLEFLCQHSGFAQNKIVRMQEDQGLHNPDAYIGVWQVLYGVSPDYALVARKSLPAEGQADAFGDLFTKDYGLDLANLAQRHDQHALQIKQDLTASQDHLGARQQKLNEQGQQLEAQLHLQNQRIEQHLLAQKQQIEDQLHEQGEYIERLSKLCENGIERAEAVEVELRLIYSSRSWRITRPMREFADTMRHLTRARLKAILFSAITRPVMGSIRYAYSKRSLVSAVKRIVKCIPGLSARLRPISETLHNLNVPVIPPLLSGYAPRVLHLERHLQRLLNTHTESVSPAQAGQRPRLAYVSPMPPQRTGIADYSAELLPALAQFYRIDVIVEKVEENSSGPTNDSRPPYSLHDADWLRANADNYDVVIYHIGNSSYHTYMIELLEDVPGIIVLHDFYLSGLIWSMEQIPAHRGIKLRELYYSHGYSALIEAGQDERQVAQRYPFNRSILQKAQGVIVHSAVSLRLAEQWYGAAAYADWVQIPLLRKLAEGDVALQCAAGRAALGLADDAFVVCSFGMLGETKLNDRLLQAWLDSDLAADPLCHLVFVGELGDDAYGKALRQRLTELGDDSRISITGWADSATFEHYLAAADVAVQLRSLSRGETSAAVLDCMNHRLPTIVNANGSMADLPERGVLRLPDTFSDAQLTEALQQLRHDPQARQELGEHARAVIEEQHTPAHCAYLYHTAIDQFRERNNLVKRELQQVLAELPQLPQTTSASLALADDLLQGQPDPLQPRQLLLDITATCQTDRHTGVERVARALTLALLTNPPAGYRVEPVYLVFSEGQWRYRYASAYTAGLLGVAADTVDHGIDYAPGDQLVTLDISGQSFVLASQRGLLRRLKAKGVHCRALIYDLLPVTQPLLFPPDANTYFADWLIHTARLDGVICISDTVAQEMRKWLLANQHERAESLPISHFHLGADLSSTAPSLGLPEDAEQLLATLANRPSVLMVGTLEPRKGHLQALDAFTHLWEEGVDANLVIVGRAGWQQLPVEQQRTIPQLLERLANHPEKGKRLFWLNGASDEFLERVYSTANGLLAASEDEGFGLPLIEAAQKGLPILARDIPVFREVAGEHAHYFKADDATQLASAVTEWLAQGCTPSSIDMPWLTWEQSALDFQHLLLGER